MTTQQKLDLIKQVGEEIVTEEELRQVLTSGEELVAYDGIEPSGQLHIAQGILRAININKVTKTGIRFKILLADWHAMCNDKMGGDLEKIKTVGKYFIEIWKACGMDLKNMEFVWASDLVKDSRYWELVLKIGRTNKLARFVRTAEFMGREAAAENLSAAQLFYPCMQIADIFTLNAKVAQLGMDQRKVNMLAREIGPQLGFWKPVSVSHHMLMGLGQPPAGENSTDKASRTIALKMSKSHPDNAIFMTDSREDVERKINKAWCPEGEIKENPVLEYCKYIIFESLDKLGIDKITIERPAKFGGNVALKSYQELETLFGQKKIHPQDLKQTVAKLINDLIEPVRQHFIKNKTARALLEQVKSFTVTR